MSFFSHPDFDQHELLAFHNDSHSGLQAIIAVHNTFLGPAVGGCRMYPYRDDSAAITDVLRLSRSMTYKAALAELPTGGGKAVIIGDPARDKSRQLFLAMGEFINSLGGQYISAEDSGTNVQDLKTMAERSDHVGGVVDAEECNGDPSPATAFGVFEGIKAAVAYRHHTDLKAMRVAIQGIGSVGYHLAGLLKAAGATVYAADVNTAQLNKAVAELAVIPLPVAEILSSQVDVLAPCALGGAINAQTIKGIKAKIIAGAANNQLSEQSIGDQLIDLDILYAPDFVINAGGIIDIHYQRTRTSSAPVARQLINMHVEKIADTLGVIFIKSNETGLSCQLIAEQMAEAKFKPRD